MSITVTCDVPGCDAAVGLDATASETGRFESELTAEGWWIRDAGDFTFICPEHGGDRPYRRGET